MTESKHITCGGQRGPSELYFKYFTFLWLSGRPGSRGIWLGVTVASPTGASAHLPPFRWCNIIILEPYPWMSLLI